VIDEVLEGLNFGCLAPERALAVAQPTSGPQGPWRTTRDIQQSADVIGGGLQGTRKPDEH